MLRKTGFAKAVRCKPTNPARHSGDTGKRGGETVIERVGDRDGVAALS